LAKNAQVKLSIRRRYRKALVHPGGAALLLLTIVAIAGCTPLEERRPQSGVQDQLNVSGFWLTALVSLDDPRWRVEDLACARTGCSLAGFEYLQSLLDDPANDERPLQELYVEMQAHNKKHMAALVTPGALKEAALWDPANDPALDCSPEGDGWRHQILAPLPVKIEQHDDRVVISYEYWNAVRTIYMDGRGHPSDATPTRVGHSIGWYEDGALVVETTQIKPTVMGLPGGGAIILSPDARGMERYTLSDDGQRLDLVWSMIDPSHFHEPLRGQRSLLVKPGGELDEFLCEAITGEF